MRALLLIPAIIFLLEGAFAGKTKATKIYWEKQLYKGNDSDEIFYCILQIVASIDREVWNAYLTKNLILDEASLDSIPSGTYTVNVQFIIDRTGKISDATIVKDAGYGLGERVRKAVEKYKGFWKPAKRNGRVIKDYHVQPVTFIIDKETEECEEKIPAELML